MSTHKGLTIQQIEDKIKNADHLRALKRSDRMKKYYETLDPSLKLMGPDEKELSKEINRLKVLLRYKHDPEKQRQHKLELKRRQYGVTA